MAAPGGWLSLFSTAFKQSRNAMVLVDGAAGIQHGTCEAGQDGAGVDGAARNGVLDREPCVAVAPARLSGAGPCVRDLPAAVEPKVAVDPGVGGETSEALEAVIGVLELADGRAFEGDGTGVAARPGTHAVRFENHLLIEAIPE